MTAADYHARYQEKLGTVQDCLALLRSQDVIVSLADCNEPETLLSQLHTIAPRLENVLLIKGAIGRYACITDAGMDGHINNCGYYFGAGQRAGAEFGNSIYVPADIPDFEAFFSAVRPCTVFMASVPPMDENGDFCAGLARQWGDGLLHQADRIILEVNPTLPPMAEGLKINLRDVTRLYESRHGLWDLPGIEATPQELKVAENCRSLLRDGDCIQLGIGGLPNAIGRTMHDLHDLGLHTEMLTTTMGQLIREGVITGARKNFHPNEHIGCFAGGDMALYETLATNPRCRVLPGAWVVDPRTIRQNDNMVSINTAIEMDLTGQITAESIGPRQLSGSGGAFDFAYGALHAKGGRGIYAFISTSKKGNFKINCFLQQGAQVTIPRNYADYIVTEYGIAPLRGRTVRQRALNLIAIAHPDQRAQLRQQAEACHYI